MKNLKALSFGEGLGEAAFVDEYKPAGKHEVEFNASSGSSFRLVRNQGSTKWNLFLQITGR